MTKKQTVFVPDNLDWILDRPFKTKPIRAYKNAVNLLAYVLNHVYTAQYTRKDKNAPISYYTASILCGGDKHTWRSLQSLLCDYGVLKHDGKSKNGVKSFHYQLGDAMKDAKWKRSKESYTFTLPEPKYELRKEIVGLTVDKAQIPAAIAYTYEKRKNDKEHPWTPERAEVWRWYLEEGFNAGYDIKKTGRIYGG